MLKNVEVVKFYMNFSYFQTNLSDLIRVFLNIFLIIISKYTNVNFF